MRPRDGRRAHLMPVCALALTVLFVSGAHQWAMAEDIVPRPASSDWTATIAPQPPQSHAGDSVSLLALSCPASGWCAAIGQQQGGDAYFLIRDSGTWHLRSVPTGPASTAPAKMLLPRMVCASAGTCVVFTHTWPNRDSDPAAGILTLSDGTWVARPQPRAPNGDPIVVKDIDCPPARLCTAVGYAIDDSWTEHVQAVILRQRADQSWSATFAPLPIGATCPGNDEVFWLYNRDGVTGCTLDAISCPSSGMCTAVGTHPHPYPDLDSGSDFWVPRGYAVHETGEETWDAEKVPPVSFFTHEYQPHPVAPDVKALDCTLSPRRCVAVATSSGDRGQPFALSRGPYDWTVESLPLPARDGDGLVSTPSGRRPGSSTPSSIDCPASGECIVGGVYAGGASSGGGEAVENPFVVAQTRGVWRPLSPPAYATSAKHAGVACGLVGQCLAVHPPREAAGAASAVELDVQTSGEWARHPLVPPTGGLLFATDARDRAELSSVLLQCPASSRCIAGMGYHSAVAGSGAKVAFVESTGTDVTTGPSKPSEEREPPNEQTGTGGAGAASPEGVSYVALGDSFSSGEGVDPFLRDGHDARGVKTGTVDNRCHRSTRAYSTRVSLTGSGESVYSAASGGREPGSGKRANKYGSDLNVRSAGPIGWAFLACSGARIRNVLPASLGGSAQFDDRYREQVPQLDSHAIGTRTRLVTITVGGNDANFLDVVTHCFLHACSGARYRAEVHGVIGRLREPLKDAYVAVRKAAPNARLLVLGYPQLFPRSASEQACAQLRPWAGEQIFLRAAVAQMNGVIESAAAEAGATFVDVAQAFTAHEVCGNGGAWVNGPSKTWKPPRKFVDDESFHPTLPGQQALGAIVNQVIARGHRDAAGFVLAPDDASTVARLHGREAAVAAVAISCAAPPCSVSVTARLGGEDARAAGTRSGSSRSAILGRARWRDADRRADPLKLRLTNRGLRALHRKRRVLVELAIEVRAARRVTTRSTLTRTLVIK